MNGKRKEKKERKEKEEKKKKSPCFVFLCSVTPQLWKSGKVTLYEKFRSSMLGIKISAYEF